MISTIAYRPPRRCMIEHMAIIIRLGYVEIFILAGEPHLYV